MSFKKIATFVLVSSFLLTACSYLPFVGKRGPAGVEDEKFQSFNELLLRALEFRAAALNFAKKIKLDQISSPAMTREDLDYVKETGKQYLALRKSLNEIAMTQYDNFGLQYNIKLTPNKGTRVDPIRTYMITEGTTSNSYMYSIDPTDDLGRQKIFDIQMALASALVLYDNYLVGIQPYNSNETFNYLLNYDTEEKKILQQIADRYADTGIRSRVKKAIDFVDDVMAWRRKNNVTTSDAEAKLYEIIQSSAWYLNVREGSGFKNVIDIITNLTSRINRHAIRDTRIVTFGLSMGFGNFVGLVETRKGYLDSMSPSEEAQLTNEMKPLDILLEKTPFRLTDKMIPGHYGHVAIWLGTEQQLRDLRAWDSIPAKYQEMIQAGHYIVEALRPGVQINTLDHFLNIDDLLVLRDKRNVSDNYRRKAVLRTIEQVGKEYDFNFDVNTQNRIVCSEIAYAVYADVKWPLDRALGRYTISPDNVAKLAQGPKAIFEPVILYYNGKRYNHDLTKSLDLLLKANTQSYAEFETLQGIR